MGKRPLVRRRGRGGIQFRAPSKGKLFEARYPSTSLGENRVGKVTNIIHERGRGAPLAQVRFEDNSYAYIPAVTGLTTGSKIELGPTANPTSGNVLPLSKIPEGSTISNIERNYGDGGKLVRASGSSATLFSQTPEGAIVRMPSGLVLGSI